MHESLNAVSYIMPICLIVMTRAVNPANKYIASVGRYPYIASIQHRYLEQYCTGVIVTKEHVLSAFSCVCTRYNFDVNSVDPDGWICHGPSAFIVVAGVTDKYMDFSAGSVRRVEKFIMRNNSFYPPNSTHFADFAMILLKKPFNFNQASIRPMDIYKGWEKDRIKAALMKAASDQRYQNCSTVGWDFVKGSTTVSTLLVLPTQLECKCDFDYCELNRNQTHCVPYCEQPNMCATFRTTPRYCGGLRGNLLVCDGKVLGLVSVPANCSYHKKKVPTVFVRMDEMLDLIWEIRETSRSLTLIVGLKNNFITLSVIIIFYYDYTYYWYVNEQRASSSRISLLLDVAPNDNFEVNQFLMIVVS